jgi:branched-chain amino acid transport system ATP-binding protein
MTILSLENVYKNFGKTGIVRGVTLAIEPGERHAIIGPNGAGKSTLYHMISGHHRVTSGTIKFKGQEIQNRTPFEINRLGLSRSFQVTNIFPQLTVFENIRCALLWSAGYRYSFWNLLGMQTQLNEETLHLLEQINLKQRAN